ncbi:hypothetical protein ABZ446_27210 [Streptomyces sp. NPDC005813]|uniref:hypothetical protein n=1 Tax=Streptomyces sp. NPDC005813 TaxID=3155592 RepID=UPI0033C6061D
MISDRGPAENATVLRYGRRQFIAGMLATVPASVLCVFGLDLLFVPGAPIVLALLLAASGAAGVWMFRRAWRQRKWAIAFDRTGFWWLRGDATEVLPWSALDGVGIRRQMMAFGGAFRSPPGRWGKAFVLEVCPRDGNPELIDISLCHYACERALWRWAPQALLFGEETRM